MGPPAQLPGPPMAPGPQAPCMERYQAYTDDQLLAWMRCLLDEVSFSRGQCFGFKALYQLYSIARLTGRARTSCSIAVSCTGPHLRPSHLIAIVLALTASVREVPCKSPSSQWHRAGQEQASWAAKDSICSALMPL